MSKNINFKAKPEVPGFKSPDHIRQAFPKQKNQFQQSRPVVTFRPRSFGGHN